MNNVHGLGFCVSVEHAKFMEEIFLSKEIPCMALTGSSSDAERSNARDRLVSGKIKFIFVVDLYNEGIDIPEVDTILFLRPTESLTVFLQQLGRGLRLSEGKECLTVLDFIGQANKKYNFEEKFAALLSHNNHSMQYEVKKGFVSYPSRINTIRPQQCTTTILSMNASSTGRAKARHRTRPVRVSAISIIRKTGVRSHCLCESSSRIVLVLRHIPTSERQLMRRIPAASQ